MAMKLDFSVGFATTTSAAGLVRTEGASSDQSSYKQFPYLITNSTGGAQGTSLGSMKITSLETEDIPNLASGRPKHFITMLYWTGTVVSGRTGDTYTVGSIVGHYQAMPMRSRGGSFFMNQGGRRF